MGRSFGSAIPDLCCTMRKVLPLQRQTGGSRLLDHRACAGEQSDTRAKIDVIEVYAFDETPAAKS